MMFFRNTRARWRKELFGECIFSRIMRNVVPGVPLVRNPSTTFGGPSTLAVPKIFFGFRLEHFDRGAKPCSLFRPLGALRKLCSLGKGGNFILQQSLLVFRERRFL